MPDICEPCWEQLRVGRLPWHPDCLRVYEETLASLRQKLAQKGMKLEEK